jgi:glutamate--glyoxylate aminotransferase
VGSAPRSSFGSAPRSRPAPPTRSRGRFTDPPPPPHTHHNTNQQFTNVGNPHALGAQPITFTRQVVALAACPALLEDPRAADIFPADAIARAKKLVASFNGGIGAYQDSRGNPLVRQEIADFINARDGVTDATPEHIFLTDGASPAVRLSLNAVIRDDRDCILVPIPQYPLYSASIQLLGGTLLPYELDESKGWALSIESLRKAVASARAQGKCVRGLVFINPGNPTGQCLSADNLKELIRFAHDEKVVLMADEVYQENIYQSERPFVSARKAMSEMGAPYEDSVELLSFHTVSKGTGGECGLRGGYVEMHNLHPQAVEELYKVCSINLSPNSVGQIAMSCLVNPPKEGEPSHALWKKEREAELASLERRAVMVADAFNKLEGVSCTPVEGAMYAFPQIRLPPKAIAAAKAAGKAPDVFYCLKLVEQTGISTVPGSGFGQAEGTLHLRTTILPREAKMADFCDKFATFHKAFMAEYK